MIGKNKALLCPKHKRQVRYNPLERKSKAMLPSRHERKKMYETK
jgi:hypothetical protein